MFLLFETTKIQRAIKNRGTEVLLSSVPTVEGMSSIVPMYHGIGGDRLELGILRPWAKTKMGAEKWLEVPPIMHSFTRSKGIARPLLADSLRKQLMLSKLNRVAMLAISFHKICMLLLARQYRYA